MKDKTKDICCTISLQTDVSGRENGNLFVWVLLRCSNIVWILHFVSLPQEKVWVPNWIGPHGWHKIRQLPISQHQLQWSRKLHKRGPASISRYILLGVSLNQTLSQGSAWKGQTTVRSVCRPGINWKEAQDTPRLLQHLWGCTVFKIYLYPDVQPAWWRHTRKRSDQWRRRSLRFMEPSSGELLISATQNWSTF